MSRRPPRALSRRRLLQWGSGFAAAPALAALAPRAARADGPPARRVVFFHWPQGVVLPDFVPATAGPDFALPPILAPLAPHRGRLLGLSGIDNVQLDWNTVGNAHQNGNYTLYSARPFAAQDAARITAGGPTVDQLLATRLSADTPFPRLDFAVGGASAAGVYQPTEGAFFFYGPGDPVAYFNDPSVALLRIFGDQTLSPADAWAQRARRSAVLDGVLRGFDLAARGLDAADRARLQAHAEKVSALERRISGGVGACTPPDLGGLPPFDVEQDDDLSAFALNDVLVSALSCDLTRVATLHFANGHDHDFPWLWAENGGPIVDRTRFDTWHAVVHADPQPGMSLVYRWYIEVLADLLDRLATTDGPDGLPLLDSTLVVALSEFSSGRHWTNGLNALLLGATGAAPTGRWLACGDGGVDALLAAGGYHRSGATTNQLWVSVLQALGGDDATFGHSPAEIPEGPLPGFFS
jgi:hypothetical protein